MARVSCASSAEGRQSISNHKRAPSGDGLLMIQVWGVKGEEEERPDGVEDFGGWWSEGDAILAAATHPATGQGLGASDTSTVTQGRQASGTYRLLITPLLFIFH